MNWELIGLVVLAVLLLVAGGYVKRLGKEIKDLVDCLVMAIEDEKITKEELANIFKEAEDVKAIIFEIAKLLARR